ncbi:pentapeptide repeat-containing protein [Subsaximicrobium wynnwilliamsii]|uniref:pentapeptide repeat-containing protein n=1 Tax=Subsaximicrobium wynnwilliamsii TaxID=291179 RepID=UPI0011BF8615|nr:pentapeptide repeat-containing protein [Subsaximicrobium wynnwilliamsii]TXD81880.1 pentapeptide repeat-containing protein [Subsaximicrobium wynnwilliamsii]TXE01331.1 pentapeptide repeat-containing protein [Subsaximicrobium wynnwilliamsii]
MNRETIEILTKLKEKPSSEKVDHIFLLQKIYSEYSNGITQLKPIALFYLNGFDGLPALKEKHLWDELKFNGIRKDFVDAHNELVELIDETLNGIKDNESDSFDYQLSKTEFLQQIQSGKVVFEEIDLENMDLRNQKLSGITFKNCFISADFRNSDLTNTKFIKSNIKTSDFRNANLTNALMQNVSFEATRFKGAKTNGFIFIDNYNHSAKGIGQTEFNDWIIETE